MPMEGTEFSLAQIFFNHDVRLGEGLPAVGKHQYDFELIRRNTMWKRREDKLKRNESLGKYREKPLELEVGLWVFLQNQKMKCFNIPRKIQRLSRLRSAHIEMADSSVYL